MKVGITGGAGFLGGYVCEALLAAGHSPVVFDRQAKRSLTPGAELFLGEVTVRRDVTEMAAHVDGIIHLAAVLGTQETIDNPFPAAETNILGSLAVFEAALQYDLPCVYIAVGNHFMAAQGAGAYVISKTAAENFASMYVRNRGGRIVVVRAMNAYGPRQVAAAPFGEGKVRKITPAFVCRALSGMPIEVYGDGEQVSDMIYASDVADVLVHGLELAQLPRGEPWWTSARHRPIEAGPVESRTVNEVALEIARICGELGYPQQPLVHLPMRRGETPGATVAADVSSMTDAHIEPSGFVPLAEGLGRTVEWFAANEGVTWHRPRPE